MGTLCFKMAIFESVLDTPIPTKYTMSSTKTEKLTQLKTSEILQDYSLAIESREMSLIGRKEVFMGKAKFGIFGDGKEVAQLAMARAFKNGGFRIKRWSPERSL